MASQEQYVVLTEGGDAVVKQLLGSPEYVENRVIPQDEGAISWCLLNFEDPTVVFDDTPENAEEAEIDLFKEFGELSE